MENLFIFNIDVLSMVLYRRRSFETTAREFPEKIHFCFIDSAKDSDRVDQNKLWKILKEMGIPEHLTYLKNLYASQEATEPNIEQRTSSKFENEYIKAVYCHPAYLTYMQSTS